MSRILNLSIGIAAIVMLSVVVTLMVTIGTVSGETIIQDMKEDIEFYQFDRQEMFPEPEIYEDQIIICVKDLSDNDGKICHVYNIDDIDWYQEISENNYGQFGNTDDSFDMVTVP